MARVLRFAPARIRLHVRCRGNQQQDVFLDDQDRRRYMELLVRHAAESAVGILGVCQMTNHVHLILEPAADDGLMARLNSEFAQAVQFRANRTGHLFQGRFKSTAMGDDYRWNALRYVELNPVRAGMSARPQDWRWSSAAAHLGLVERPGWLDCRAWSERWDAAGWAAFLRESVSAEEQGQIQRATREMRPLVQCRDGAKMGSGLWSTADAGQAGTAERERARQGRARVAVVPVGGDAVGAKKSVKTPTRCHAAPVFPIKANPGMFTPDRNCTSITIEIVTNGFG